jgi:F0F1-type ATP synthase assembly protein I
MPDVPPNRREFAHYLTLAQVGVEMVAPIAVGLALDHAFGWAPWGIVGGAIFGLIGGVSHLVALMNRRDQSGPGAQQRREGL